MEDVLPETPGRDIQYVPVCPKCGQTAILPLDDVQGDVVAWSCGCGWDVSVSKSGEERPWPRRTVKVVKKS